MCASSFSSEIPTEQELAWATSLKDAALSDPTIHVDEMTDWEFLQHANISKDNIPKGLKRIRHLQAFKRRYGIIRDGSDEEAARDLKAFLLAHPGLYMSLAADGSVEKEDDEQSHFSCPQIFCSTYDKFNATRMKNDEAYKVYMRAAFYALNASQHNLAALRAGMVLLMDIRGALRYRSYRTESRARELYGRAYPIRIQRVVLINASTSVRLICRIIQPWLSPKAKQLLTVAAERDDYLKTAGWTAKVLPQEWGGNLAVADFADTVLDRLRERYQKAEAFRL